MMFDEHFFRRHWTSSATMTIRRKFLMCFLWRDAMFLVTSVPCFSRQKQ